MSIYDGLGYYYNYLGLDPTNFLVQFNSGITYNYDGLNHPEFARSSASHYPQVINAASGLNSPTNRWTHFFIYNKTGVGDGILFSNFAGNYPYSGYAIGVTDDHKFYFESYDNTGPVVKVGTHINSNHNAVAITKDNSTVSFNYFDFNAQQIASESFSIQDQYVLPSNVAYLGGASSFPSYSKANNFPGVLETYAYMTESFSAGDLGSLFSGFYSYYDYVSGAVTSYSYSEITGYQEVPFGYSGVTGYQTVYGQIGTGRSGVPISGYYSQALSGVISGGYNTIPLSGSFTIYQTGDPTYSLVLDSNFPSSFKMNGAAILIPQTTNELDYFYAIPSTGAVGINKVADYDFLKKTFELDNVYKDSDVDIFLDGTALSNLGYSVTGNIYSSGYNISGDYFLNGFDVILKGTGYGKTTNVIYDALPSGQKQSLLISSTSGNNLIENLGISSASLVFLNGSLLSKNVDYSQVNNKFQWVGPTRTGTLSAFTPSLSQFSISGVNFENISGYQRNTSRLFLNGKRLTLGVDYYENSSLDFLKNRTILESGLSFLYNNDNNYFEN